MKQIKFSHKYYEKFHRLGEDGVFPPFKARLLQVFLLNSTRMSEPFQHYDTTYYVEARDPSTDKVTVHAEHYPLNSQKRFWLVLLLEEATTMCLFTTVRSHTPQKEKYYRVSQGDTFEIVYTGG